ncbi:hypothetical protein ACUM5Y_11630 [Marinomonas dokdonensis]|uniref:hypothetical protein n=1 Tax=Marinomonas dokdonensis TaxID=328224 RepID=UPI004055571B
MGIVNRDKLSDVTYWMALEISKSQYVVDLDSIYRGSLELDYLYQLLTTKATLYWRQQHAIELTPVMVNNAFFRAIGILQERQTEYERSRNKQETNWVKALLHLE